MTGAWKQMNGGIMLWIPVEEPDVTGTQESLSKLSVYDDEAHGTKQDHNAKDTGLPSIQDLMPSIVEDEFGDEKVTYTPDSCTLAAESEDEGSALDRSSTALPHASTDNLNNDLYHQLRSFVPPEEEATSSQPSSTDYDSDGTDFLEIQNSPCPGQTSRNRPRQTKLKSHYFKAPTTDPVRRTLDFGAVRSKVVKRTSPKSTAPEYSPPHKWRDDEREYLCCLWRWFRREPTGFASCFNEYFGTKLSMSKIRDQFENHIRLYGPAAFSVYRDVLSVPFHNPNQYSDLLERIASTARSLGIDLHRLEEEVVTTHGRAAKARSTFTRKCFRSLVRKVTREEKAKQSHLVPENPPHYRKALGGMPLTTNAILDEREMFSDAEDSTAPAITSSRLSQKLPIKSHIAFRVWDANSRTLFSEEDGFVSEAHALWRGDYIKPFSDEGEGKQALMFLSNIHLCMKGGGTSSSSFVSVSTSLLQILTKHASSMKQPWLAVVDLDHPLLQEPNKVIHAQKMLKLLKSGGQAWWAKYKGHAEYMIWASLPRACVMSKCPLSDLQDLAKNDQACAELLSLDVVQSGQRVKKVSSLLQEKNTTLDFKVAKALGTIGRTFGLDGDHISTAHITSFVARLVDGWSIRNTTIDLQTKSTLAATFAKALSSRSCHIQEVIMAAFMDGIEEGSQTIAYYASRRS